MIFGDLPPSSRVTFFNPAERTISLPTAVDPVKAIFAMSGCRTIAAPVVLPKPERTLITPGGNPASLIRVQRTRALNGVCSAVLRTTVFPQARAGATFHAKQGFRLIQGRGLNTEHGEGEVPWNDLAANTEWFVHSVLMISTEGRKGKYGQTSRSSINNLPLNLIRPPPIITNNIRRVPHIIVLRRQKGLFPRSDFNRLTL